MTSIQKQLHQVNWRFLESVNKILWRFPLNLMLVMFETSAVKRWVIKKFTGKVEGMPQSPRSMSFLITLPVVSKSTRQLINSLFEFMLFENHSSIWLTALNRPTIRSLILKHWVPSWVENGIKWVNRKIGVHVVRPKWTLVNTWVRVPTWLGTHTYDPS